jgi:hypothetical protein
MLSLHYRLVSGAMVPVVVINGGVTFLTNQTLEDEDVILQHGRLRTLGAHIGGI